MRDDVGQTNLVGDPLIPVDDVEVSGGAGVSNKRLPGNTEIARGNLVPDVDAGHAVSLSVPRATSTV